MNSKICPKCNSKFTCYNPEPCWCTPIKLSKEHLDFLKENYSDCLCKNCLIEFSNKNIIELKNIKRK